jgi:microcin C transport system substrate-binding protein
MMRANLVPKPMHSKRHSILSSFALAALIMSGCGKQADQPAVQSEAPPATGAFPGMEADLQRTLKEQSSFYFFKAASDLAKDTQGLKWEDGSDLPPLGDPSAKKGGTLNVWIPDFPGTFRTLGPDSNSSFRQWLLDYTSMDFVRYYPNQAGKIYPELATSWAVDTAHATVYFKLDPDARWSDGVPFTTDDVVFSWYLFRSPHLDDPWLSNYFSTTFSALTVYDAHTFSLTLKEMRPDIVVRAGASDQAMPPFPKHFFKDFGPGWVQKYNWRICPTVGAYTFREEDVKRTSSVTLSHVKDWWGENKRFNVGRFNPDRIRLNVIREPDKAFEAFLRGDLDVFPLTTVLWYDRLPDNSPSVTSGFTVKATFFNRIPPPDFGLWINEAVPPLDNVNIRLGIQYASDFDLVCKQYFRGDAVVQKTPSDGYGWDVNPSVKPRPFDPAKAREYFAKAGYTQQGPDGVLTNAQGRRLSFTITSTYRQYQDVLVILKQEALKAGLEFNVEVLDETTGWQKTQEKKHEITLAAFQRTVDMFPRYWDFFAGDNAYDVPYLPDGSPNPARKIKVSTNNLSEIANFKMDQLIHQYDKAETMEQVKALSFQIEQMLYDDAAWVNGWKRPYYRVGYRPWVKWPADFNVMQSTDEYQFWMMWIDPDIQKDALAAKAEGRSLPKQILTYDRFKEP